MESPVILFRGVGTESHAGVRGEGPRSLEFCWNCNSVSLTPLMCRGVIIGGKFEAQLYTRCNCAD